METSGSGSARVAEGWNIFLKEMFSAVCALRWILSGSGSRMAVHLHSDNQAVVWILGGNLVLRHLWRQLGWMIWFPCMM